MSTFRNCQTFKKLILVVLFIWKDLITGTAVLNAEVCLPNQGKISPKVAIPGRNEEFYKTTLVSLLNEDPQLSHDRYYFKNYCRHWATRFCYKTIVN